MQNETMLETGLPPTMAAKTLRRNCLSFIGSVAQSVGTMAPTGGMSLVIPFVFASSGNGTWLLLAIATFGYILMAANLSFFARKSSSTGALYSYVGMGLGEHGSWIAAWSYALCMLFCVVNAVVMTARYTLLFARSVGYQGDEQATLLLLVFLIVVVIWIIAGKDVRLSAHVMLGTEIVAIGLILVTVLVFLIGGGHWIDPDQFLLKDVTWPSMATGSVVAFFCLAGFESVTTLGEETREAGKNIPRALISSVIPVGLLYVVCAYIFVFGFRRADLSLGDSVAPFGQLAKLAGLPQLGIIINLGILLCFFACSLGCLTAGSRILYALARDGAAPARWHRVHRKNATPISAINVVIAMVLLLIVLSILVGLSFEKIIAWSLQMASLGFVLVYLLVSLAAFVFLKKTGEKNLFVSISSLATAIIFLIPLSGCFYPVPPAPERFLPYLFVLLVFLGLLFSIFHNQRNV